MYEVVTPAKAGVQEANPCQHWIPAFAGMTLVSCFIGSDSGQLKMQNTLENADEPDAIAAR
jgi:hypothetical protein